MPVDVVRPSLRDVEYRVSYRPQDNPLEVRTMKVGFVFDGSKAERELKITYTPVRVALEEATASYQEGG